MTRRPRALLLSEGAAHGSYVLGPVTSERVLAARLADRDDVDARLVSVGRMHPAARLFARHVPLVGRADLDLAVVRWHLAYGVTAARVLRRELARADADVVHVNSHSISFLMTEEMKRRPFFLALDATVWSWHRMGANRKPRRHSRALLAPSILLERRALTQAHTVLAWTRWALDAVRATAPRAHVVELPPGVDLERFRPAPRETGERPRLLFVGGDFARKGGHDLLAALEGLVGSDVELDVVTPGPVPAARGVRVHRLGPGDDRLVELFRHADLFCLPTYADAMGWSVIEAMGSGVPVIATDVGAIPEVLGHGEAGVIVEPGDRTALRAAIEELLRDEDRRAELGARGRARAERHYDARKQTDELVALLRDAAG